MKLSIGIVGLPNVGKSTLFNALLKKSPFAKASEGQAGGHAKIANYPFTTIDPNIGIVAVPDERLPVLAKIVKTEKIVPAVVEFYDIAGLVKGAAEGQGLGNKFLSHIREVAAIVHVVRFFEDANVVHVSGKIDPLTDIQIIESELILADLETLNKQKEPRSGASKTETATYEVVKRLAAQLNKDISARNISLTDEEKQLIKSLNLLTLKPVIYAFNVSDKQLENSEAKKNIVSLLHDFIVKNNNGTIKQWNNYIFFNAKLENEVLSLPENEQKEYLRNYQLEDTGLNRLIKKSYQVLGLISFLTARTLEARAWTLRRGDTALRASQVIHTDFAKHFIKADIVPYEDFVKYGGWEKCRDLGKVQIVGRDYVMKDGDVVEFKVGG